MKRLVAALVFTALPLVPASAAAAGRTFETPDGSLSFTFPSGWKLTAERSYVSVLSPLVGPTPNGHLRDGEFKVEYYLNRKPDGLTLQALKKELCGKSSDTGRTVDCRITSINGRSWVWALRFEERFGWVRLIGTIRGNRRYSAVGLVPDGEHDREGLAATKSILLTTRVSKPGLAATGSSVVLATLAGIALVGAGTVLRRVPWRMPAA